MENTDKLTQEQITEGNVLIVKALGWQRTIGESWLTADGTVTGLYDNDLNYHKSLDLLHKAVEYCEGKQLNEQGYVQFRITGVEVNIITDEYNSLCDEFDEEQTLVLNLFAAVLHMLKTFKEEEEEDARLDAAEELEKIISTLEYDADGETDGISYETWVSPEGKQYKVPIEIVRDFDSMEEIIETKS